MYVYIYIHTHVVLTPCCNQLVIAYQCLSWIPLLVDSTYQFIGDRGRNPTITSGTSLQRRHYFLMGVPGYEDEYHETSGNDGADPWTCRRMRAWRIITEIFHSKIPLVIGKYNWYLSFFRASWLILTMLRTGDLCSPFICLIRLSGAFVAQGLCPKTMIY